MNPMTSIKQLCQKKDSLLIRPAFHAEISLQDKISGEVIGPKSVRFSTVMTLWQAVLWLGGLMLFFYAAMMLCRAKWICLGRKKRHGKKKSVFFR